MNSIEDIQKSFKDLLHSLLNSLNEGFDVNELAYLSSQGKNELQIRDKIAWRLHNEITEKLGNQYIVCREWSPKGFGRAKVDLAVLELDASYTQIVRTIALIEFKAQSIVKKEKWYLAEFEHDIKKMKEITEKYSVCRDADMYFVFLETGQEKKVNNYKPIIAYSQYQAGKVKFKKDVDYISSIHSYWMDFNKLLANPIVEETPKIIYIGEAYGYKQYISPLIIGPLKTIDIKS